MPTNELKTWQAQAQAQTELLLARLMPSENQLPQSLHETMRYAALDGGKRLRPLLVLAASELGEAVPDAVEAAMAAIELIHVYSLVHDDMPAMDNDSLRRGRPTCHIRYGEAAALLAGDALQTLAFDLLSRPTALPPQRQLHMLSTLARASGSLGMAGGQAIDLANVGRSITQSELEQMHSLKTGALIRAAAALGALAGGAWQTVGHYGSRLLGKLKGARELTVNDAVLRLLALRQRQLLAALQTRGHAAVEAIRLETPEDKQWREGKLPEALRKARAHPEWSSLNGRRVGGSDRQEQIDALAELLESGRGE